jgi:small-conductance mechanosensitive channel
VTPVSDNTLMLGGLAVSSWVYGPVAFAVWVGVLWLAEFLVLNRLRRSTSIGAAITRALGLPAALLIFITGLLMLQHLLPLAPNVDAFATGTIKVLLIVLGIVLVDRVIILVLDRLAIRFDSAELGQGIIRAVTHAVVFVVGVLVLLGTFGISITPLVASLGVASLAVALALQGPLSNLFAGLLILADRSLKVGDFIVLDSGEKGYIEHIGLRHTRVRMLPDDVVIVPNEKLASSTIHNTHLPERPISFWVDIGVHYDSDLEHVERVTLEVARKVLATVEGAVADHEPFVRFRRFGESSIDFRVILRVRQYVDKYRVTHEFIKALHARFREEGIVIPFPLRTIDIPDKTADTLRDVFQGRRKPSA